MNWGFVFLNMCACLCMICCYRSRNHTQAAGWERHQPYFLRCRMSESAQRAMSQLDSRMKGKFSCGFPFTNCVLGPRQNRGQKKPSHVWLDALGGGRTTLLFTRRKPCLPRSQPGKRWTVAEEERFLPYTGGLRRPRWGQGEQGCNRMRTGSYISTKVFCVLLNGMSTSLL